uniref:Uncharacterized protein n=1 Tax=Quercus lobata TaxID=97700 RepID=A0A7N2MX16_QUELO
METTTNDVFNFGVVLLQLLTGRKPESLFKEARNAIMKGGSISAMADPCLSGAYIVTEFQNVLSIAVQLCEAAPTKKADSATKRARQAEKRRIYNKPRKSEIKTRMKKDSFYVRLFSKRLLDISDDIMILELMSSGSNGFFPCKSKVGGVVVGSRPIQEIKSWTWFLFSFATRRTQQNSLIPSHTHSASIPSVSAPLSDPAPSPFCRTHSLSSAPSFSIAVGPPSRSVLVSAPASHSPSSS